MMKYRDHSLKYVPRSTKRPSARPNATPPSPAPNEPSTDEPFNHRHSNASEPIIDVNDSESRLQKIKDNVGTVAHAGAYLTATHIVPGAKKHAKKVSKHVRSTTAHHAPKVVARAKHMKPSRLKTFRTVFIIIALLSIGYYAVTQRSIPLLLQDNQTGRGSSNLPVGGSTPDYTTLVPTGKDIQQLGGWQRVSPPDANPVFAFIDTLDGIQISVSQQPLPDNFSTNPDKEVKDLALGFNASNRRVADDATVYFIGTSTKGPQSVILAKDKVLILMKSPSQIKDASWGRYIASLE